MNGARHDEPSRGVFWGVLLVLVLCVAGTAALLWGEWAQ